MDDRRRDGRTNSTLRTKEQRTHLTLNEHDDNDDDDDIYMYEDTLVQILVKVVILTNLKYGLRVIIRSRGLK